MIHTCLTSHIYLNWCFDLSACFDQVWEDSLIADADQKKFPFSPRWTCYRAGIFSVNYKLFTIQAIFLLNHLLRTDGNRYVYKLMHSNQWWFFLAKLYSTSIVIIHSHYIHERRQPPREPLHHSLTFVIGRETDWTEEIQSSLALKHYDYCIKAIINCRIQDLKSIIIKIGIFYRHNAEIKCCITKLIWMLHLLHQYMNHHKRQTHTCISRFFNQDV